MKLRYFWLGNALRATTACNSSSRIWPHGSAPAALASLLFDPPEPQIIGKTQCFATFLPFRAPASSFFWLFLFCDLLSSSLLFSSLLFSSLLWLFPHLLFHLFILSEVWLLNFLRWYCALLYYHRNDGVCTMGIIPCTIEILDIWYPHMLFPIKGWHGWYGDGSSYLWNCHMNEEINIHNAILFGVPNTDDMEEVLKIWGSPRHRKTIHGFQCWNALNDLDDLGVPHGFWRLTNNHRES